MSTENIPMYYYSENGEVVGPFTVQELAGKITPDSLVVSENATKWVKASDVPEISDILFVQLPDEAEEFIPDELDVEDDSLLEVETENLEIVTPSGPLNYNNNNNHVVYANENIAKPRSWILPIIIVSLLVVIGGSVFFYFKSDYYKWKSAVRKYCYIPTLKIRTDTVTFSESNVISYARYGESFLVLNNPELTPWIDIKYDNDKKGVANNNFLMSENDFNILSPLLDTEVKQKQIENSKLRRSLVNHIISQSRLKSMSDRSWALNEFETKNNFIKARKNYYNKTEAAIFYLQNGSYSEVVAFIYNDGKEVDKKSISDYSNYYNDFISFLNQYNLQY